MITMGRPREQFCKVEPTFIFNDLEYLHLSPHAKLVYLTCWFKAFQDRSDVLPRANGELVRYLAYHTKRPE